MEGYCKECDKNTDTVDLFCENCGTAKEMSAFEEWYADFLYYEGEPTKDIAKQAWDAAFQRMTVADNQTLAALKHEGYVLVPVEPTEAMFKSCYMLLAEEGSKVFIDDLYKAMIQAAQIED